MVYRQKITFRPNWEEVFLLYGTNWDWSKNLAVHLYARFIPLIDKLDRTEDEIKTLNSTYGEIARFILYDNKEIISLPNK